MKIYGIKCIYSEWNGCDGCNSDEYLLDYFFSTYEKAKENLLKNEHSIGFSKKYEVVEIELDSVITKPEYRRNSL